MKTVLFIDYFFPPLAGDYRGAAFAKLFPEFGWKPIVLSAAESVTYGKDYYLLNEIPKDLEIHRVPHREPSEVWQSFRRKLKLAWDFPDYYRTWYSPACEEGRKILHEHEVDLIYSASPTYTAAFVAMKLSREFNVPWVADFLDGWAVNDFLDREYDRILREPLRSFHKRRIRCAERAILKSADRVVVIHEHVKERWCKLHDLDDSAISVITDGYDESIFDGLTGRSLYIDRPTITFLGSYYWQFKDAILEFARAVNEIERTAELIFVGRAAGPVHMMNLRNSTCILPVSRRTAIEFALGSDFLFLVMPPYAKWTPTKTYDYLRIGKPILALVPRDGDAAKLIRESRSGFILEFDGEDMKDQLRTIFRKWREGGFKGFRSSPEYVAKFERRKLTEQMVHVFNEVSAESRARCS